MGKRDGQYVLSSQIELDEGFFSTEVEPEEKNKPLKRGRGSQEKSKVLVMAESKERAGKLTNKGKPRKVGFIKMLVISDLKAETINLQVATSILPWVHLAISNAKRILLDLHHNIKPEFLQGYLNEFCYKFNRSYYGEAMFERLLLVSATSKNDFSYRIR